jgi:hypothetical protein
MSDNNAFMDFLDQYGPLAGEMGPVLFAQEVLGLTLDEWQILVLRDFGRGERRITIRACHGPGKTLVASVCIVYQLLCRFPQKAVATAPSKGQLEGALLSEVKTLVAQLPELLQDRLDVGVHSIKLKAFPSDSFFSASTAREEKPEALQGRHSKGYVLLIADEASGVGEAIFEAAAGSMAGHNATTLLLSNPVRSSGFFFDTHMKPGVMEMWCKYHISADDSPRVSDDFVQDIAARYGEDSNAYRIRVLGEFPLADDDTIIPYDAIVSAQQRDVEYPGTSPQVWALDVARFGNDANVFIKRNRVAVLPDIQMWQGRDLMYTTGRVKSEWDKTPGYLRPEVILVDEIGLGAGVVDRLRELGLPARGINVGETAALSDQYRDQRTELWFRGREWLVSKNHSLPVCEGGCPRECLHERLAAELALLRFKYTSGGKQLAESKDELKKRGHSSPNVADAFMLTFASEPSSMLHGPKGSGVTNIPWSRNVSRNIAVV